MLFDIEEVKEEYILLAFQSSCGSQGPENSWVHERGTVTYGLEDDRVEYKKVGIFSSWIISQGHIQDDDE